MSSGHSDGSDGGTEGCGVRGMRICRIQTGWKKNLPWNSSRDLVLIHVSSAIALVVIDVRGPFRTKHPQTYQKIVRAKIVHTSGQHLIFLFFGKCRKITLKYVPIYRKYTKSESDIQNNKLWHKIYQQCQNAFDIFSILGNISKNRKGSFLFYFVFYINSVFCKFSKLSNRPARQIRRVLNLLNLLNLFRPRAGDLRSPALGRREFSKCIKLDKFIKPCSPRKPRIC